MKIRLSPILRSSGFPGGMALMSDDPNLWMLDLDEKGGLCGRT
jgi:hypothetical protein